MDSNRAQKYKGYVLEQMCACAEDVLEYFTINNPNFFGISFGSECPEAFKPGTGDKLIFSRIIDEYFEGSDVKIDSFTGILLMFDRYYPIAQYGKWHRYSRNGLSLEG